MANIHHHILSPRTCHVVYTFPIPPAPHPILCTRAPTLSYPCLRPQLSMPPPSATRASNLTTHSLPTPPPSPTLAQTHASTLNCPCLHPASQPQGPTHLPASTLSGPFHRWGGGKGVGPAAGSAADSGGGGEGVHVCVGVRYTLHAWGCGAHMHGGGVCMHAWGGVLHMHVGKVRMHAWW